MKLRAVAALLIARAAAASLGDRQPYYASCVSACHGTKCDRGAQPPWTLRLLFWDCAADCAYECMHRTQRALRDRGLGEAKFHGKWCFTRVLGIQEPGAAVFSALNAAPHLLHLAYASRREAYAPRGSPLRPWLLLWSGSGAAAWLSAAAFHTRDTEATARLDYATAFGSIVALLALSARRLLGGRRPRVAGALSWALCAAGAVRAGYVLFFGFDYGRQMLLSVAATLLAAVTWLAWSARELFRRRRRYAWKAGAFFLGVSVLGYALEVRGDFPPVRVGPLEMDAHAFWHARYVRKGDVCYMQTVWGAPHLRGYPGGSRIRR